MKIQSSELEELKKGVQKRKRPQQTRAKKTIKKILDGAKEILSTNGRKGLSARKLADKCGISTGAIYDNFPGISAILFALYEERMNQELDLYRNYYGNDTGELAMNDLIDGFAAQDATLEWGSELDKELNIAIQEDEKLKKLQLHCLDIQRNLLIEALQKRNNNANEEKLKVIASYLLGINQLSFQLRHVDKLSEQDFILDIAINLAKKVASIPLT